MDLSAILKQLYQERELLDQAIASLERAQAGTYNRRGRPPKWLAKVRQQEAGSQTGSTPNPADDF